MRELKPHLLRLTTQYAFLAQFPETRKEQR